MLEHHSDSLPSGNAGGNTVLIEHPDGEGTRQQIDREQLARDIAEIESATAALCKGEPTLQSWTNAPVTAIQKPRPLWLLIGVLWLSTALVTVGAVVAIATFVG